MTRLITGITGFVGTHLAELLLADGEPVIGFSRGGRWPSGCEKLALRIPLIAVEMTDSSALRGILRYYRPDQIYHLAGQANVPASWRDPVETWRTNFVGSQRLFEAVLDERPETKILAVSTGAVYGTPPPSELPITERTALRPTSPYAVSKAAADLLAGQYLQKKLRIVVARPFNHIGPRQESSFAIAHFAKQIAELEQRDGPAEMRVGRIQVERDFTDVRDVVRAYRLLMDSADAGELFIVASGRTWPMETMLKGLLQLSTRHIKVIEDPALFRPDDPPIIRVSPAWLQQRTDWKPIVPLEQTLLDTLEYWRAQIGNAESELTNI